MSVGKVEEKVVNGEAEIEWEIPDFLSVIENENFFSCTSPAFYFTNDSWNFEFYRVNAKDSNYMALYLRCESCIKKREYSVAYTFGMKKRDGTADNLIRMVLSKDESLTSPWNFITRTEVIQRKSELVPSGNFTITCRLKAENISSIQSAVLNDVKLEKFVSLDTLSENFKSFFFNKESCDVTLCVMDKVYKAHRAILMARSSVFSAMFLHESSEKQTGIVTISDCDPESFYEFLKFLYCGKLEELSSCTVLHMYEISDKYDVQDLKTLCKEYLMKNLTVKNMCGIVIIADKHDDCKLSSAAQEFFNENMKQIFNTSEWDSLVKNYYRLSKKLLKDMSSKVEVVR